MVSPLWNRWVQRLLSLYNSKKNHSGGNLGLFLGRGFTPWVRKDHDAITASITAHVEGGCFRFRRRDLLQITFVSDESHNLGIVFSKPEIEASRKYKNRILFTDSVVVNTNNIYDDIYYRADSKELQNCSTKNLPVYYDTTTQQHLQHSKYAVFSNTGGIIRARYLFKNKNCCHVHYTDHNTSRCIHNTSDDPWHLRSLVA